MSMHLAILRTAGWLVPSAERTEWFAEWNAELCHVVRVRDAQAFAFCLGAFKDAWWFRRQCRFRWLESPLQCLLLLGILAAISVVGAGRALLSSPFRDARGLLIGQSRQPLAGAAFYREMREPVVVAHRMRLMSVVQASGNLFDALHVAAPHPGHGPVVILNREFYRNYAAFERPDIGQVLEIVGEKARIDAIIPDDTWPLPGEFDAWLLEDEMPAGAGGTVVARIGQSAAGDLRLVPPPRRFRNVFRMFLTAILLVCLIVPATTWFAAAGVTGMRWWAYLLAKAALLLPTVYAWISLGFTCATPAAAIFILAVWPGSFFAFRWVLTDQKGRCPVCLRPLSNPVHFGKASQTFLAWYGTELMCGQGHGLLRVPELAGSYCNEQQWVNLDELCPR